MILNKLQNEQESELPLLQNNKNKNYQTGVVGKGHRSNSEV